MSASERAQGGPVWLEVAADYRCNNRCVGCFSAQDAGPSLTSAEVARALQGARREGARHLWLGGGEPTLRRDLFAVCRAARQLGFERIKLQTNGMLIAYEGYAERCRDAGVTEIAFSIKSHQRDVHDVLTRTPGCFDLMERGIAAARAAGLDCEGDVLVYRSTVATTADTVRYFSARGVQRFRLWALSAADMPTPDVLAEVPRLSEVAAQAVLILAERPDAEPEHLLSLHTPPCTLGVAGYRARFDAARFGLTVLDPTGRVFRLEQSGFEGGTWLPGCSTCAARPTCGGARRDYLDLYGSDEFVPLAAWPG